MDHIRMLFQQARPRTVNGIIPLLCIGKDVTVEEYNTITSYLNKSSKSNNQVIKILGQLMSWKHGQAAPRSTAEVCSSQSFPFANLHVWLKHILTAELLEILRKLVFGMKPIVLATYSKEVSTAAFTGLKSRHSKGYKR